ncbi:methionine/alanine import family NSS transporter small subunit [Leucobacter chromiiresistens]|uniref:Putative methionine and alanine importer, small subunit n=1 Tax=Leucobacter chromiiresistens TaxID=1079994 RepID=A0A1H0Z5V5_9MICO|nr:methionine/alanine import family NSS transporter small subunit [Leucobacter chromiiresistens]SDQ22710.1 Putative methionine and alanine importer, small subunit [Leucobacter chromiiresistens]
MTTGALIMMVLSIGILWGGLAWSILRLRKHPDVSGVGEDD